MSNDDRALGAHIKALREAVNMTQAQLAEALAREGLSSFYPQTVTRVELGQRSLKVQEAVGLAHVLGVSLDVLCHPTSLGEHEIRAQRMVQRLRRTHSAYVKMTHLALQEIAEAVEIVEAPSLSDESRGTLSEALGNWPEQTRALQTFLQASGVPEPDVVGRLSDARKRHVTRTRRTHMTADGQAR